MEERALAWEPGGLCNLKQLGTLSGTVPLVEN